MTKPYYAFPLNTTTHGMCSSFWVDGFTKENSKSETHFADIAKRWLMNVRQSK